MKPEFPAVEEDHEGWGPGTVVGMDAGSRGQCLECGYGR